MTRRISIAIDGPAGSGKSTIAKTVASTFGYIYIDTGAMYRAVTLKALRQQIPVDDHARITVLAELTDIRLENQSNYGGNGLRIFLDGEDVSEAIRSLEVTGNVSPVAAVPGVRTALVRIQRRMSEAGGVVMDGRDIGTVVLPQAELKVFLTASVAERTRRRWLELQIKGIVVDPAELERQIEQRDYYDSHRETDPLRQAEDAILLDTTAMTIDEVCTSVIKLAEQRGAEIL